MISLTLYNKLDYSAPVLFVPYSSHVQREIPKAMVSEKVKIVPPAKVNVQKTVVKQEAVVKKETIQPKITTVQKATVVKKEEEKKVVVPEKKQIKQDDVKSKEVQTNQPKEQKVAQVNQQPQQIITSSNYREVEAMRRGMLLQKELAKNWKPPRGMQPNCSCDITATVGTDGKIIDLKIDKSSGILMYDVSARQAFFSMSIPQWAHGKSITVSFKQ